MPLIDLTHNPEPHVVPYDSEPPKLCVVACDTDGRQFVYKRPFAIADRAHVEYFARTVRAAGFIESEHWSESQ